MFVESSHNIIVRWRRAKLQNCATGVSEKGRGEWQWNFPPSIFEDLPKGMRWRNRCRLCLSFFRHSQPGPDGKCSFGVAHANGKFLSHFFFFLSFSSTLIKLHITCFFFRVRNWNAHTAEEKEQRRGLHSWTDDGFHPSESQKIDIKHPAGSLTLFAHRAVHFTEKKQQKKKSAETISTCV